MRDGDVIRRGKNFADFTRAKCGGSGTPKYTTAEKHETANHRTFELPPHTRRAYIRR